MSLLTLLLSQSIEHGKTAIIKPGATKSNPDDEAPVLGSARWRANSQSEVRVLDTTMRVTTPENISFEYRVTGPFRRFFAYLLDVLICLGGFILLSIVMYLIMTFIVYPLAASIGGMAVVEALVGITLGMTSVLYFIIYWFYGAYMETYFNGQTLGKKIVKMRVISTNGHAIDGVQATLRNFFRLLDIMPFVPIASLFQVDLPPQVALPTCLFGLFIMSFSRRFQRVGDLVANTVVVNEEIHQRPELATFDDARVRRLAELIPTSFVVPASMARAIAEYVEQRQFLHYERLSEIACHVANPLIEKFGLEHDTDHDLFLCSLYFKTFVSSDNGEGYRSTESSAVDAESAVLFATGSPEGPIDPSKIASE